MSINLCARSRQDIKPQLCVLARPESSRTEAIAEPSALKGLPLLCERFMSNLDKDNVNTIITYALSCRVTQVTGAQHGRMSCILSTQKAHHHPL